MLYELDNEAGGTQWANLAECEYHDSTYISSTTEIRAELELTHDGHTIFSGNYWKQ